jgi:hypothetical protein
MYRLHRQGEKNRPAEKKALTSNSIVYLHSMVRLLVTLNVVPSLPILVTLMMEAIHSSEISVLTTATLYNIPDHGILQDYFIYGDSLMTSTLLVME